MKEIRLSQVIISNYIRYPQQPQTFTFESGKIIGIFGKNGVGKTSILDAVTFTLFGFDSKSLRNKGLANHGFIEVVFESNEDEIHFKKVMEKDLLHRYFKDSTSSWVELGDQDYKQKVKQYIGLEYKAFINSSFIYQDLISDLTNASPRERLETFKLLFNLKKYDNCHENTKGKIEALNGELKVIDAEIEMNERKLEDIAKMKVDQDKDTLMQKSTELQENLDSLTISKQEISDQLDQLEKALTRLDTLQGNLDQIKSSIAEATSKIQDEPEVIKRKEEISKKISGLESERSLITMKLGDKQNIEKLIDVLKEKKSKHDQLQLKLENERSSQKKIENEKESVKKAHDKKILNLDTEISSFTSNGIVSFEEGKDRVQKKGFCNGFKERIDHELTNNILKEEFVEETRNLGEQYAELLQEFDGLEKQFNSTSGNLQILLDQKTSLEQELTDMMNDLDSQEENIVEKISEFVALIEEENVEEIDENITMIKENKSRLDAIDVEINKFSIKMKDMEASLARIEELRQNIGNLVKKQKIIAKEIASNLHVKEEYKDLKANLDQAYANIQDLKSERDKIAFQLQYLENNDRDVILERIEELKASKVENERELKALTVLKEVFQKNLVAFILTSILPIISHHATIHAVALSNGRITGIRLLRNEKNMLDCEISGDGRIKLMNELSSGEKVIANLALVFSTCQTLASLSQIRIGTIFLDEARMGSLDQIDDANSESNLKLFLKRLRYMLDFYKNIIVITQLPIYEFFDDKYKIVLDKNMNSQIISMKGKD